MKCYRWIMTLCLCLAVGGPALSVWDGKSGVALYAATPQKKKAATAKKLTTSSKKKSPAKKNAGKKTVSPKPQISTPMQKQMPYQQRVAAVQRHNAQVAAYLNRDIAHRIGGWGQAGYSVILSNGFANEATSQTGFRTRSIGGVGGGVGLGYQLRYRRFLFTTGAEWQSYNSHTRLSPVERTFAMSPYESMRYTYSYPDMQDYWRANYIQLPLLFGMEYAHWYWQVGGKIGVNVSGHSTLTSTLTTSIRDEELIEDLHDMYTHALVTGYDIPASQHSIQFGWNAAIAAELGMSLDRWLQPKIKRGKKATAAQQIAQRMHYRVAIFAEYGIHNIRQTSNIRENATDIPADFSAMTGQPFLSRAEDLYQQVRYTSSLSTSTARNARLNPLMVGVKLSMYYEWPRQNKKVLPLPAEPLPRIIARARDAETGKAIAGVQFSIEQISSNRVVSKTSNNNGIIQAYLPKGLYRVSAAKSGYKPCDTISYDLQKDLCDTLYFALRPNPVLPLYTLCGYVYDKETHAQIEDAGVILQRSDNSFHNLYQGSTNEEGLFVSDIQAGKYRIVLSKPGYLPCEEEIAFEKDTLHLYMTHIQEGIKVKINHLYFATNKTTILPESEAALNELAKFLQENPAITICITGHTDAVGSDEANMRLSIGRAKAVRANLIARGIDAARMEFAGKGKTEPVATNDTEEGRAQNRRVEFEIISTHGENVQQVYE